MIVVKDVRSYTGISLQEDKLLRQQNFSTKPPKFANNQRRGLQKGKATTNRSSNVR
jgi:hypothetical protein